MTALRTDQEIEELLSRPSPAVIETVRRLSGDFMVLGVGGKMGTSLALMLRRALDAAGKHSTSVTGVSRFSRPETRLVLEAAGVRAQACDLAEAEEVKNLPDAAQVLYLAGQKFGTGSSPGATWIQNTVVPALVAQRYARSRLVVFSTGCVYPFTSVETSGSVETDALGFNGEYASSCVGRERVFGFYGQKFGTRQLMFRLNYAVELRYGVLVDIATHVHAGEPVDVSTGWLNCIWQGDACAQAIRCLEHVSNPPTALNITGPEKLSVREIATEFGRQLGREPRFVGTEAPTAWLSNARRAEQLFGPPEMSVAAMIPLIAAYVRGGGELLGKPTHFEVRSGNF